MADRPDGRTWYAVTVKMSWHETYKVLAKDDAQVRDLVDRELCLERINPVEDNPGSYDCEIDSGLGSEPEEGEDCIEEDGDGN